MSEESHGGKLAPMLVLWLVAVVCGGCSRGSEVAPPPVPDAAIANEAAREWQLKHEADYRRDWVTIAGLHPLQPGSNTAGSAATNAIVLPASTPATVGRFTLVRGATASGSESDERVRFEPAPGVSIDMNGKPLTAATDLRDDSGRDRDVLEIGDVRLAVHVSGGRRSIRVWDPDGPQARGFLGFSWFPVDASYRVVGLLIRDSHPQSFKVLNTYGEEDEYRSEGVVEFTLHGQTLRLRPFTTRPKRFYFVFRDASSGQETYETARFLYSDLRDDGTTVLDFNMAYNPPCAFNPYTTCPIPLRENRLPVKILAGEKDYPVHVSLPTGAAR
jgi:uncharacterized protein (DUF1684 family)